MTTKKVTTKKVTTMFSSNGMFGGMQIIESVYHTEFVQFSRSPARAKRRAKRGYRQHFVSRPRKDFFIVDGNKIVVHPTQVPMLREALLQSNKGRTA